MKPDDIVNVITIIGLALPVITSLTKTLAQITHNKAFINLSNKADVIVRALEQNDQLSSDAKKERAVKALTEYANELGIKVTDNQVSAYIESSVNVVKTDSSNDSTYMGIDPTSEDDSNRSK